MNLVNPLVTVDKMITFFTMKPCTYSQNKFFLLVMISLHKYNYNENMLSLIRSKEVYTVN